MIRIIGVDLPENKHIVVALTTIYGIGKARAYYICNVLNINIHTKVNKVSNEQINAIRNITNKLILEGDLHRVINTNIKRLIDIGAYRGLRHKSNLPVRGQRTKTNARTCKNKKNKKTSR